jgi:hypothetical protein
MIEVNIVEFTYRKERGTTGKYQLMDRIGFVFHVQYAVELSKFEQIFKHIQQKEIAFMEFTKKFYVITTGTFRVTHNSKNFIISCE